MFSEIKDFVEFYRSEIIVFGLIGIASGGLFFVLIQQEKIWRQFVVDHNCVVVERIEGSVQSGYGYGLNTSGKFGSGVIVTTEPDKTVYACNDGVRYTR
jgi:hypothetical protein